MAFIKGKSGNPKGRPAESAAEELRQAMRKYAKLKNQTIFERFIEQSYIDNGVLIAVNKKLLPDKKQIDADIQGNVTFEVVEYKPKPNKEKDL